jgi:glucose 1-dehydrogenase/3-oxoacyl-[acyl-carrier protein] reductase
LRLKDKVALVTGAGRGLGRGIAEVFADEGAHVAINFIESPDEAERVAEYVRGTGRRAMTVHADVACRAEVEPMIEKVWRDLGQPREIGNVVAFFASDEASYLTGQSIHVDGGWAGK